MIVSVGSLAFAAIDQILEARSGGTDETGIAGMVAGWVLLELRVKIEWHIWIKAWLIRTVLEQPSDLRIGNQLNGAQRNLTRLGRRVFCLDHLLHVVDSIDHVLISVGNLARIEHVRVRAVVLIPVPVVILLLVIQ